jgi:hypothetical protein
MSMIQQALAEFDESRAMIASVKEYGKFTLAVDGIGKVEEAHKQVKRLRINITKRGKELRDGATKYSRAIIEEEKRLVNEVEPIESALWYQRQIHEEQIELERVEKEKAKRAFLTARIEKLAQAGCVAGDVDAIAAMNDDEFSLHFICEKMKAESAREQAEIQRMLAEKLEADRLAEIARQAEEMCIRQEELDRDRKAMQAEREAMLHQQQVERRALEEQQAEIRRQQEEIRKAAELKAEEERQRVLAERRAEDIRLAEIASAEAEVARLARLEALKPEIEKAKTFCNALDEWAESYLEKLGVTWADSALVSIERACIEIIRNVERGDV